MQLSSISLLAMLFLLMVQGMSLKFLRRQRIRNISKAYQLRSSENIALHFNRKNRVLVTYWRIIRFKRIRAWIQEIFRHRFLYKGAMEYVSKSLYSVYTYSILVTLSACYTPSNSMVDIMWCKVYFLAIVSYQQYQAQFIILIIFSLYFELLIC